MSEYPNGQMIDRYQIIRKLGQGGMAVVYEALDTRLERKVALKIILPRVDKQEVFLARFDREAKALAKLTHPYIVPIFDYGSYEDKPYLVMEYLPGKTLKEKMGKPFPFKEAASLLIKISQAVGYAHQHKVIHRDIKPGNILFRDEDTPLLSDFGISKLTGSETPSQLTATGVSIGTPDYISPEQGKGIAVDQRSDIYSLGVIFYELITGKKPYQADTPLSLIIKHITEPLPSPREIIPSLPLTVEQVICKALEKEPDQRFQTTDEFIKALQSLLLTQEEESPESKLFSKTGTGSNTLQSVRGAETQDKTRIDSTASDFFPEPEFNLQGFQENIPEKKIQPKAKPEKRSNKVYFIGGAAFIILACIAVLAAGGIYYLLSQKNSEPSLAERNMTSTPLTRPSHTYEPAPTLTKVSPVNTETSIPETLLPEIRNSSITGEEINKDPDVRPRFLNSAIERTQDNEKGYVYSGTINGSEPLFLGWGWCTTTDEILEQNLEVISYEFFINSEPISRDKVYLWYFQNSDGNPCAGDYILIDNWPEGEYYILVSRNNSELMNDGWDDYPAMTFTFEYYLTISPSE